MAEKIRVGDQWYVSAKSARADENPHVLKHDEIFVLFDRFGDMQQRGFGQPGPLPSLEMEAQHLSPELASHSRAFRRASRLPTVHLGDRRGRFSSRAYSTTDRTSVGSRRRSTPDRAHLAQFPDCLLYTSPSPRDS